ncbi:MAG: hotdog fold thioesterase, partial [Bacteroidetes bacterium]|nr:hotdog fold thioesterase [Bacteroidota bacterium]
MFFNTQEISLDTLNQRNKNTMSDWLGIELCELGSDFLTAKMPVDHRTVQPLGVVNGGAFCALAETVGSVAANLCLDRSKQVALGLDINANHIRSANKGFVYGKAIPFHIGKTTQVWEIKITDDEGKLCCISR